MCAFAFHALQFQWTANRSILLFERTNLPVESMGFPEYKFPNKGKSFVHHEEVLAFFQSYASEFHLNDVVKLAHFVVNVTPVDRTRWEVYSSIYTYTHACT